MYITNVIVIGAGGTGSYLIPPLARFLASQPVPVKLLICDGDKYSESNSGRQEFASSKIGINKAEVQALTVCAKLPEYAKLVDYLPEYLSASKINELITNNTVVVTCVDNVACRHFVEKRLEQLQNAAHVAPGNEMYTGQCHLSLRVNGVWKTRSLFTAHPELNSDNDDRSAMDCAAIAALPSGGQIIMSNFMAAALALNYIGQLFEVHTNNRNGFIPCDNVRFDISIQGFGRSGLRSLTDLL